jgi:hypothetical protein
MKIRPLRRPGMLDPGLLLLLMVLGTTGHVFGADQPIRHRLIFFE